MNTKISINGDINNRGKRMEKIIALILGFLCCNNIFYAFVVGSTPIMFIYVYAILAFALLLIKNRGIIPNFWHFTPASLKLFLICLLLSGVSTLFFFRSYMYQFAVGIIQLLLHIMLIMLVAYLKDCKNEIYKGIVVGIIINFLFVVYGYIKYSQGTLFTLNDYFPAIEIKTQYIGNAYRGQGLFKEPGHLMRFVAVMIIPVYTSLYEKFSVKSVIVLAAVLVISAFSLSSSLIILLVGCLIYYLLINPTDILKKVLLLAGLALVVLLVLFFAKSSPILNVVVNSFQSGLDDAFSDSSGNEIRSTGISSALAVIQKTFPIGSGWNTFTKVFGSLGYYSDNVKGSYSEVLSLIGELGISSVLYLWFVLKTSITYMRQNKSAAYVSIGVSLLIYLSLMFLTDYGLEAGMAVLLGVVIGNNMDAEMKETSRPLWSE